MIRVGRYLGRVLASLALSILALSANISLIQQASAQISPGRCGPAVPYSHAFDARGYYYPAMVQACERIIVDATKGPQAALPGQFLFLVQARLDHAERGVFMRGFPNRSYPVANDETLWAFDANPPTSLATVPVIPPFAPSKTVYLGQGAYGFYGLSILGGSGTAFPLSASSVIVGVSGYGFNSPHALQAMLSYLKPTYLPVLYFQRDEARPVLRRAFIRFMPRGELRGVWESTIRSHPMQTPSAGNPLATWAGIALSAGVIAAFVNSPLGQNFTRDYHACLARGQPTVC